MVLTRSLNQLICRVLIGVFLFAQMAVAAYACPGLDPAARAPAAAPSAPPGAMPDGCDEVDTQAANLCAEHCKFGQQSSDTGTAPAVMAPALAVLYVLAPDPASAGARCRPSPPGELAAATSPPHAILHCVLRI
jgi:hypothetical protein